MAFSGFFQVVRGRTPAGQSHGRPAGFTLIELLVVVAIISILAGIAVPNFLEAQTRAKVSRMKNDQRSMATAIEAYLVDNNRYPRRTKEPAGSGFLGFPDVLLRTREMSVLTTPISYISTLPKDIFENRVAAPEDVIDYYDPIHVEFLRDVRFSFPDSQFDYTTEYARSAARSYDFGWMLLSVGPDKELGNPAPGQGNYPVGSIAADGGATNRWMMEYDPTNGTISYGNITRFQRSGANATDAFEDDPDD